MATDTFDEYRQLNRVSISALKHARKSALSYKWHLEHPQEDKPAWAFGRAVHAAVFEPAKFVEHYAVWTGGRKAGGLYNEFLEANKGREVLSEEDHNIVRNICDVVRNHPLVTSYLVAGEAEARILWHDKDSGLDAKGRADFISTSRPTILDLKTTRDISRFSQDAAKFDYALQAYFYCSGVRADPTRGQDLGFTFVVVESTPPHDVGVFAVPPEVMDVGKREVRRLLDLVSYCKKHNTWPGVYEGEQTLVLPDWYMREDDDELELTYNGEAVDI